MKLVLALQQDTDTERHDSLGSNFSIEVEMDIDCYTTEIAPKKKSWCEASL